MKSYYEKKDLFSASFSNSYVKKNTYKLELLQNILIGKHRVGGLSQFMDINSN